VFRDVWSMMQHTKERYRGLLNGSITPEARFDGDCPSWPRLDRVAHSWVTRIAFAAAYVLFYVKFAPHWAFYALLPLHFLMGPVHGAIVNWAGHKYGYRNFETSDRSRNTLLVDVLTAGELFQNNHHRHPTSPSFAKRWFEVDPTFAVMRVLRWLGIIELRYAA